MTGQSDDDTAICYYEDKYGDVAIEGATEPWDDVIDKFLMILVDIAVIIIVYLPHPEVVQIEKGDGKEEQDDCPDGVLARADGFRAKRKPDDNEAFDADRYHRPGSIRIACGEEHSVEFAE